MKDEITRIPEAPNDIKEQIRRGTFMDKARRDEERRKQERHRPSVYAPSIDDYASYDEPHRRDDDEANRGVAKLNLSGKETK